MDIVNLDPQYKVGNDVSQSSPMTKSYQNNSTLFSLSITSRSRLAKATWPRGLAAVPACAKRCVQHHQHPDRDQRIQRNQDEEHSVAQRPIHSEAFTGPERPERDEE